MKLFCYFFGHKYSYDTTHCSRCGNLDPEPKSTFGLLGVIQMNSNPSSYGGIDRAKCSTWKTKEQYNGEETSG